ncbi:16S rRNA (uracil(1498)-N(3))-methyltransferase [Kangiella sediminilitoris]|uniref:Ribosomal RNA small subunit methyltransferase E n=1 Tax=Kangiella sediminilitoris TaxID=1144748 RepID=A0A1B3BDL1_9GAMM|nr:16S rRNA (uracil(1498)-N(3))-methyltransferase [Kangiella sediminilitoris]AOE50865.1 Ribosomal RNA small subunit methyltransferase E [Kangiella sediminilitoris]
MRISRIYTPHAELRVGQVVTLGREPSNHLSRVLRLKVGNEVVLFNGNGSDFPSEIVEIERNSVSVHVKDELTVNVESPLHIHLYQGVSRGDKMDLTLQKGVELGIKEFTPLITERCGVKLDAKRWQKKLDHWQKVIESACEQCGRSTLPKLNEVISFNEAIPTLDSQSFFLHPEAAKPFNEISNLDVTKPISLWVGPEGGFSDIEIEQVKRNGCQPVQLGPRVLRTETAALSAVSVMNVLWGDF